MKHPVLHPGLNLGPHHGEAHDQTETLAFGFWVFLMSDLIIFGLMFATYATMANPTGLAGGPGPRDVYDLTSVFAQTMILLTSSLTFGMASLALRFERGKQAITIWLAITLALGLGFLTLEILDFRNMINAGAVPSRSGFWSSFWGLVPLHGLHVFAGSVWITIMIVQIQMFGMVSVVKTRIVRLGLFWHFLDLIWIGIFTIVYLGALAS